MGKTMCLLVPFIELTVSHTSVLTILAITVERFVIPNMAGTENLQRQTLTSTYYQADHVRLTRLPIPQHLIL